MISEEQTPGFIPGVGLGVKIWDTFVKCSYVAIKFYNALIHHFRSQKAWWSSATDIDSFACWVIFHAFVVVC